MSELHQREWDDRPTDHQSDDFRYMHTTPHDITRPEPSGKGPLLGYTIFALGLALFIRFFIAAPYVVSGSSMEPNFDNWDYLITDRVSYRFDDPSRGDVIVFQLPQEPSRTLIKRIVGLPGETISIHDARVHIVNSEYREGFDLAEPYLESGNLGGPSEITTTLGADQYFVLGDNRRVSSDSRSWGLLPRENIVGRVLFRLFPLSKITILPAEARYLEK